MNDRCCAHDAAHVSHWRVIGVSDPDGHRQVWREANRQVVSEVIRGSGFSSQRIFHACSRNTRAVQYNLPQHGSHNARGSRADHVFHVGKILFQHAPFIIRHFRDVAWRKTHAVIGEYAKCRRLLEQCNVRGPYSHRQIRRNI